MRSRLGLPSCGEARVNSEVAGSVLWCISYKQPGWGWDGAGGGDEDEEKGDGEMRASCLLWRC